MAELNFGLLNPPGSQSIGNAFVTGMDQAAAARAQENQNALAQYTLSKAKRDDELTNQLLGDLRGATTNEEIYKAYQRVGKGDIASKLRGENLTQQKTQLEIAGIPGAQAKTAAETKKLQDDARIKGMTEVASFPDAESANAAIDARLASKTIDQTTADQMRQGLTPENFTQWKHNSLLRILSPEAQLKQGALTYKDTDLGSTTERQAYDAQGKPVGPPVVRAKTAAPRLSSGAVAQADLNAAILRGAPQPEIDALRAQVNAPGAATKLAQDRFKFDQTKFAYEKANPGFELKEAEDGSIVGVNKRTLQTFPVTVGGAAPTAAPMAGTGMPGARLPAPSSQAIPGTASVLDQQAPAAAPVAGAQGMPLMGKGTAMTEAQSNAAVFGGAMAQAQNTIKQLEKSGTVKNAVVPGLLTGLAKMVPFGVGDNIGNVIQSTFNADPTGLIGPNAEQQKLAQAQLAFANAYLRKTSGAAFGASEITNTIQEFFPLQGEGKKIIEQKAAARERAVEGMKLSTNREGKKYIQGYGGSGAPTAASGGNDKDPLGLR